MLSLGLSLFSVKVECQVKCSHLWALILLNLWIGQNGCSLVLPLTSFVTVGGSSLLLEPQAFHLSCLAYQVHSKYLLNQWENRGPCYLFWLPPCVIARIEKDNPTQCQLEEWVAMIQLDPGLG